MKVLRNAITAWIAALMLLGPLGAQGPAPAEELPILGLAGVTFKVSDLDAARGYYARVLGFAEAFALTDEAGHVTSAFFKINDDQYIEVTPNLEPDELQRLARVVVQSSDLDRLHQIYSTRGLNPSPVERGPDGNPVFGVQGPSAAPIHFIEYVDGSRQALARGQFLSPDRISTHLWHVGVMTEDREAAGPFYEEQLGFGDVLPGGRDESIDTPSRDSNTETKHPRLDPDDPATRDQYVREQWGAVNHIALEVPDMRLARDLVQARGGYTDLQVRAHVGNNRHWLMHIFDPDGSRTEVMETGEQDELPSMTVMAPGSAVRPPILPAEPRVIPWP